MNDSRENTSFIYSEDVIIGDRSSHISSAIVILLCIVPIFSTILFGAVDNVTWVFITIFGAAITLLWIAEAWKGKGLLLNPSSIQIPMIGLLLIGIVQLLPLGGGASGDLSVPVSRALSLDPYNTRFFILHLVIYTVFFAACLTFINKESRLKKAFLMVIIFGSVMAFFGILQRLANPDGIYGLRSTPQSIPFGPFVNQHHFAAFMEMTGGVTIGLLFGKRTARDKKILLAIAMVIMAAAIVLTSSRGGMLGIISVTAFVALINFFSGRWSKDKRSASEHSGNSIQQKAAIACSDPPGTKREVVARLTGDVRNAVAVVDDGGPGTTRGLDMGCADWLEVFGEVVLLDICIGHVTAQRGQRVVQRQLVERVRCGWETAVVARRKDVAHSVVEPLGAVVALSGRRACRRCGHDDAERDGNYSATTKT